MPAPAETLRVILTGKDELSPTMRQVRDGLKKLGVDITSVVAPAAAVAGAMAGVAAAGAKLFGDWQEYTLTIGDFAAKLGTTTEEASALTEMAGDLGVPLTSLETAFKKMSKEGIDPSIEGLVAVRERLNAAKDPAEKLALATSLLGRAGADLIPMFDQLTNDELRNYIDTMGEGQVVSQREVELARKNRAELDELGDAWKNFGLVAGGSIAELILPPLERLTGVLSGEMTVFDAWADWFTTSSVAALAGWQEAIETHAVVPLQNARGAILGLNDEEVVKVFPDMAERIREGLVDPMDAATGSMQDWGRTAIMSAGLAQLWGEAIAFDGISAEETKGMMGLLTGDMRAEMLPTLAEAISNFNTATGAVDDVGRALSLLPPLTELEVVTYFREVHGGGGSSTITTSWGSEHERRQEGGPLPAAAWTLVGERGYELIDPTGYVHPHEESTRLLASLAPQGIQAGAAGVMIDGLVGVGGAYERSGAGVVGGYSQSTAYYGANPPPVSAGGISEGGAAGGLFDSVIEEVQQAAAAESAALVASIPAAASAAASEQGRTQVIETRRIGEDTNARLDKILRAIEKQTRTLPTIVRDAVERVL